MCPRDGAFLFLCTERGVRRDGEYARSPLIMPLSATRAVCSRPSETVESLVMCTLTMLGLVSFSLFEEPTYGLRARERGVTARANKKKIDASSVVGRFWQVHQAWRGKRLPSALGFFWPNLQTIGNVRTARENGFGSALAQTEAPSVACSAWDCHNFEHASTPPVDNVSVAVKVFHISMQNVLTTVQQERVFRSELLLVLILESFRVGDPRAALFWFRSCGDRGISQGTQAQSDGADPSPESIFT